MFVVFDLDDTLIDQEAVHKSATAILYKSLGVRQPFPDFLASWYAIQKKYYELYYAGKMSFQEQRRARIREILNRAVSDDEADRIVAPYVESYNNSGWPLFPDVIPCLDRLASAHRLGIITNGESDLQRQKLARIGLTDRFDVITVSSECGCVKPNPKIFLDTCAKAGVSPGEAVYIGDRYDIDACAARKAGLYGIWLDRNALATPEHVPPIISTLDGWDPVDCR